MTDQESLSPEGEFVWSPRFAQVPTFMRLPMCRQVTRGSAAIVGIPFDGGASFRPGARFGPRAIREASTLINGISVRSEQDLLSHLCVVDRGDIDVSPFSAEGSFACIEKVVAMMANADVVPFILGGDHSVSLPVLRGIAQRYGKVGLIHFDSHSDTNPPLRGGRYHHGTPFRWAIEEQLVDPHRMIQVGIRGHLARQGELSWPRSQGVRVLKMDEIEKLGIEAAMDAAVETVGDGPVHVSFDLDVVDPAFAPGTGTPVPGGLTSREALYAVRRAADVEVVSFDVVELSPAYDHASLTSLLAASIVYEALSGLAVRRCTRH